MSITPTPKKNASSYIAAINGGVAFLKLIGVVKDGNSAMLSSIMEQMTIIGEQISDMDRKLDNLTEEMSKLQASVEFNARIENAFLLEASWKDFEYRYMEDGLDNLMTQYSSKMRTGLQLWCRNEGQARIVDGMDNTSLVLAYDNSKNGYKLIYTRDNGRPELAGEDARILVLDSDILPQKLSWNVNTYRESIKTAIVENIKDKIAADGLSSFSFENFPVFETGDGLTDELLYELAEDAVNLLTYRVTSAQVNADSVFSLQVVRQFTNYCTHLMSEKNGLSDTPGKDTEPGATPAASKDTAVAFKNTTVPSEDTAVASEDLAVISKAAESGSEINENAKAAPDTMRSFERALPWIIGGAVAVALAAVVLMKTSRSKRG